MEIESSIFTKIIRGEIPSEKIYEDQDTFAFLDITPVNSGHVLVVPKLQYETIFEAPKESWSAVMETVRMLAPKIKAALSADGINIMMNNGSAAGQVVPHVHVHIIPRFKGDGREVWHGAPYPDGQMRVVAEKIRQSLTSPQ